MKQPVEVTSTITRIAFIVVDTRAEKFLLEVTKEGLSPFACTAGGNFNLKYVCEARDESAVRKAMEEVVARLNIQASAVQTIMRIMSRTGLGETSEVFYVFAVYVSMKDLVSSDNVQVLDLAQKAHEKWDHLSSVHRALIERTIDKVTAKRINQDESVDIYTH